MDGQILINHKDTQQQDVYELTQQSGSVFQNQDHNFLFEHDK